MSDTTKRPPTVWLAQTLLIIFTLLWLGALVINLAKLPSRVVRGASITHVTVLFSTMCGFMVVLLASLWGLAKRKMYGRWLAVVSLIVLWAFILLAQLYGLWKVFGHDSSVELVVAALFYVLHGVFLALILRLAFAKSVREFFRKEMESGGS